MQNAKDTFYEWLRDQVMQRNPAREVALRGVLRPGVLVAENELPSLAQPADCFCLHWQEAATESNGALPLVRQRVEIAYATAGSATNGGMDRGRLLAAMDTELIAALTANGSSTTKRDFRAIESGKAPVLLATRVWWSAPVLNALKVAGPTLTRAAEIDVWSYSEAGER